MTYSLIIPTLNAEDHILALMDAIRQQTLPPCEIIIIDSSSTDNTCAMAISYGWRVERIQRGIFDHGGTRTYAARKAQGDILLFLTQDALPANPNTFEQLLAPFSQPNIAAVYGKQLPYPNAGLFGAHLRQFNYSDQSYVRAYEDKHIYGLKTAFLSNSFCAYRTTALEQIGYFKNNLILGEDMIAGAMLLKKGYCIAYEAHAKVFHSHNYTLWQEFKRYFDIGVLHCSERWLLDEFGKPEGEGLKYVVSEFRFLISHKKSHLVPYALLRNIFKYIGYKLGKIHHQFPPFFVKYLSMHRGWWNKPL